MQRDIADGQLIRTGIVLGRASATQPLLKSLAKSVSIQQLEQAVQASC